MATRRDEILTCMSACEWMEQFRQDGEWLRYRDEEKALLPRLERLGVAPPRDGGGEIDTFATIENLMSMLNRTKRRA